MLIYIILAIVLMATFLDFHLGYGFSLFGWLVVLGFVLFSFHVPVWLIIMVLAILSVAIAVFIVKNNRTQTDKTKYTFELVGKEGKVVKISEDGTILVEVDGDTWISYPENKNEKFKPNDPVVVTGQNGLKLKIKKKE